MRKATNNYIVDVIIGLAFVASAISGLAFLVPFEMLPVSSEGIAVLFGLSLAVWNDVHTVSSLVMITGVGLHLVLHWQWIMAMTKKLIKRNNTKATAKPQAVRADGSREANDPSRRQFLAVGGGALAGLLMGWGLKSVFESSSVSDNSLSEASAPEPAATTEDSVAAVVDEQASHGTEALSMDSTPEAEEVASTPEAAVEADPTAAPADESAVATEEVATPEAETTQEVEVVTTTRCPKGLINDPYPGRCGRYIDKNGNGICDYSEV